MSEAISSILSQIRAHSSRIGGAALDAPVGNAIGVNPGIAAAGDTPAFSETLSRMINGVSESQNTAGALTRAFEMGDPKADLARVMVASQQSSVAFKATVEVRNRLVQSYQDVMSMAI